MTAIVLDTDIAAAVASTTPGSLALDKINAQQYRIALTNLKAFQDATIANEAATIDLLRLQQAQKPPEPSLREKVTLAIVDKYMTTGTATTAASVILDAQNDAARLRAAVDAVVAVIQSP